MQHLVPIKHVAGLRLDLTIMRKKLVKMKRLGVFLGGVGKSCFGGSIFRGKPQGMKAVGFPNPGRRGSRAPSLVANKKQIGWV